MTTFRQIRESLGIHEGIAKSKKEARPGDIWKTPTGNWYGMKQGEKGEENPTQGKGSWEQEQNLKEDNELRLLESICVQHEIDHLNGKTIHDRENKPEPLRVSKKWGRNEIVGITDGKDYKEIKYKKAKPLLDSGEWEIYIGGPIT